MRMARARRIMCEQQNMSDVVALDVWDTRRLMCEATMHIRTIVCERIARKVLTSLYDSVPDDIEDLQLGNVDVLYTRLSKAIWTVAKEDGGALVFRLLEKTPDEPGDSFDVIADSWLDALLCEKMTRDLLEQRGVAHNLNGYTLYKEEYDGDDITLTPVVATI